MKKVLSICLIALFTAVSVPLVVAADKPVPAEKAEKKGPKTLPFRGKIAAVDATAKVITVGERKFHVTTTTKFMKAGKPATFADATVGEEVGGAYYEEDSKLQLASLRIGPKPVEAPKEKKEKKEK